MIVPVQTLPPPNAQLIRELRAAEHQLEASCRLARSTAVTLGEPNTTHHSPLTDTSPPTTPRCRPSVAAAAGAEAPDTPTKHHPPAARVAQTLVAAPALLAAFSGIASTIAEPAVNCTWKGTTTTLAHGQVIANPAASLPYVGPLSDDDSSCANLDSDAIDLLGTPPKRHPAVGHLVTEEVCGRLPRPPEETTIDGNGAPTAEATAAPVAVDMTPLTETLCARTSHLLPN